MLTPARAIDADTATLIDVELAKAGRNLWTTLFLGGLLWPAAAVLGGMLAANLFRLARASVSPRWTQLLSLSGVLAGVGAVAFSVLQASRSGQLLFSSIAPVETVPIAFAALNVALVAGIGLAIAAMTDLEPRLPRLRWGWSGCWWPLAATGLAGAYGTWIAWSHWALFDPTIVSPHLPSSYSWAMGIWLAVVLALLTRLAWAQDATEDALRDLVPGDPAEAQSAVQSAARSTR